MRAVTWTQEKLALLDKAIKEATAAKVVTFRFDGHEFAVAYAQYLSIHLRATLGETA